MGESVHGKVGSVPRALWVYIGSLIGGCQPAHPVRATFGQCLSPGQSAEPLSTADVKDSMRRLSPSLNDESDRCSNIGRINPVTKAGPLQQGWLATLGQDHQLHERAWRIARAGESFPGPKHRGQSYDGDGVHSQFGKA